MVKWKLTENTGNIVVIGVVAAGFFAYTVYQQRQGRSVTAKKVN